MTFKKLLKKTYSIIVINIAVFFFSAKQEGLLISDLRKGIIPEAVDMNGRIQMQGAKNWILPK